METYDKSKIGKLIAWGGDHFVYDYGENEVLKFSILEFLLGNKGMEKTMHDYEVAQRFFAPHVLETRFVVSPKGKHKAKIQRKIQGHPLTKEDLKNEMIREQFSHIMEGYRRMAEENHAEIDLIGRHGAVQNIMSNILVTPQHELFIFDTTLLEVNDSLLLKPLFYLLRAGLLWRQNSTIKLFTEE